MVKDVGWDDSVREDEASRAAEAPPFGAVRRGSGGGRRHGRGGSELTRSLASRLASGSGDDRWRTGLSREELASPNALAAVLRRRHTAFVPPSWSLCPEQAI